MSVVVFLLLGVFMLFLYSEAPPADGVFNYVNLVLLGGVGSLVTALVDFVLETKKDKKKDAESARKRAEEEVKKEELEKRQREQSERSWELERLEHEKKTIALQREIDHLKNPPPSPNPDEEMFDQYLAKRTIDTRESIFKAVLIPTMTAMELEKVYEKQKIEINRDPSYTDAQKDRLLEVLSQHYRKAMANFGGSSQSIYED